MGLVETIRELNTNLTIDEEEYKNTSDFLEWFYYNICCGKGFTEFPILYQVTKDSNYESIQTQCKYLINSNNRKNIDDNKLIQSYENMKQWLLDTLNTL